MECVKNCCKNFMKKKGKEQETQVIKLKMPPNKAAASGRESDEGRRGVTEDYLLSKLPPDGREVPFVLPTFRASYIQPQGSRFPNFQSGLQSSARCTYAERKAELLSSGHLTYSPESGLHRGQMVEYISPGSTRRDNLNSRNSGPQSPGRTLEPGVQQRLSSSMFDLSSPQGHMQRFDSVSSVLSSTSSVMGSIESSLESITLSGDERELGKVCVRLSYQEALEQVWITLVQCSDLNLPPDGVEQQKIGFKGIITIPKPIQFKSSTKESCQDVSFMETFVFTLRLNQLRCSALVLRLQTHNPRKRTAAECVLSLRQLGPQETDHWLDLNPPSKSSVGERIPAANRHARSLSCTHAPPIWINWELGTESGTAKMATVEQLTLSFRNLWVCHSELHLTSCFQPVNGRIQLQILAAQNLPASSSPLAQAFFVKAEMHQLGRMVTKKKTRVMKASGGQCQWAETFRFQLAALDHACSLSVKLYSRSSVRRKQCLGQVQLGFDSPVPDAVEQWKDMMAHPEKVVAAWHRLSAS